MPNISPTYIPPDRCHCNKIHSYSRHLWVVLILWLVGICNLGLMMILPSLLKQVLLGQYNCGIVFSFLFRWASSFFWRSQWTGFDLSVQLCHLLAQKCHCNNIRLCPKVMYYINVSCVYQWSLQCPTGDHLIKNNMWAWALNMKGRDI